MIDLEAVRILLRSHFALTAGLPVAAYRKYENTAFNPPDNAMWVSERFLVDGERQVASDLVSATGIITFAVHGPTGKGTKIAGVLAKAIKEQFAVPQSLQSGALEVAIDRAETVSGFIDEPWYIVPTLISWRVYGSANN